jgi:hypothetical protein
VALAASWLVDDEVGEPRTSDVVVEGVDADARERDPGGAVTATLRGGISPRRRLAVVGSGSPLPQLYSPRRPTIRVW